MTDCCNKERQHSKTLSSLCATVTDNMSKLGYTSVSGIWETRLMKPVTCYLSQNLLPAIRHVSSEFIF